MARCSDCFNHQKNKEKEYPIWCMAWAEYVHRYSPYLEGEIAEHCAFFNKKVTQEKLK